MAKTARCTVPTVNRPTEAGRTEEGVKADGSLWEEAGQVGLWQVTELLSGFHELTPLIGAYK